MALLATDSANADQIAYWNGPVGERWQVRQETQDRLLATVQQILLERAAPRAGEVVIDVGCGCGSTTLALAQSVGETGRVLGIDISAPMLARARERTPPGLPVQFVHADATVYPFESADADLLFSRFGVMFFSEPEKSFANLRRGLRQGARLIFACWRKPQENPWLMLPLQEAYRHVPRLPESAPTDPGPFAFSDEIRVRRILQTAGFAAVDLEPVDLRIDVAGGAGLDAAVETAASMGPASRALEDQPAERQAAALQAIRTALAQHQRGNQIPLPAAIWLVRATSPSPV